MHKKFAAAKKLLWCFFFCAIFSCVARDFSKNKTDNTEIDVPNRMAESPKFFHSKLGCQMFEAWSPTIPENSNHKTHNKKIVILSLNDLHGQIAQNHKGQSRAEKALQTLISACEWSDGNVVLVDAGDSFQGSFYSDITQGQAAADFLETIGTQVATFGNHEFDNGTDYLKNYISFFKHTIFVTTNIRDSHSEKKLPGALSENVRLGKAVILQLPKLKVGFLGTTTASTAEKVLNLENLNIVNFAKKEDIGFADLVDEAKNLRLAGAEVVVLLSHAGGKCDLSRPFSEGDSACHGNDELYQLLQNLPSGTIDAAIAGHTHQRQQHIIANVPVIQTEGLGKTLGYLQGELQHNKWRWQPKDPVPLTQGNITKEDELTLAKQILAKEKAKPFETRLKLLENKANSVLTHLPANLDFSRNTPSKALSCVTEMIWQTISGLESEFFILNSGSLRGEAKAGPFTVSDLYAWMPYNNRIFSIRVDPDEWKNIWRMLQIPNDLPVTYPDIALAVSKKPNSTPERVFISEFSLKQIPNTKASPLATGYKLRDVMESSLPNISQIKSCN